MPVDESSVRSSFFNDAVRTWIQAALARIVSRVCERALLYLEMSLS
jgi:hypothetical protein